MYFPLKAWPSAKLQSVSHSDIFSHSDSRGHRLITCYIANASFSLFSFLPQVTIIYQLSPCHYLLELHPWYCHSSVLCSLTRTTVHLIWGVCLHICMSRMLPFPFLMLKDIPPNEILKSKLLTRYKDFYGFHSASVPHLHCSHFLAHAPCPWHAKLPVAHCRSRLPSLYPFLWERTFFLMAALS